MCKNHISRSVLKIDFAKMEYDDEDETSLETIHKNASVGLSSLPSALASKKRSGSLQRQPTN